MTSLFFNGIARLLIAHVTQLNSPLQILSSRHVATELIGPKSDGLCYFVCHSATCVWDQSLWHRWVATESTACVVQFGAVTDWWCSWPMANTLPCLSSCQRRTFWTYFVIINLFYFCFINFMFLTITLDVAGDVLRVQYKSMKCNVAFSQSSVTTIFRWAAHRSCMCKNSSCLQHCKNYKNRSKFPKVTITYVLPPFYGSLCSHRYLLTSVSWGRLMQTVHERCVLIVIVQQKLFACCKNIFNFVFIPWQTNRMQNVQTNCWNESCPRYNLNSE